MTTATLPSYDRAYVLSDLHLGGGEGFQMFSQGDAFVRFCTNLSEEVKSSVPTLLLINGDFVDFLAEEGASYWNGSNATEFLRAIAGREALKPVFDGLRKFVARPGARLVITLGNHDLELVLPEVRSTLVEILTNNVKSRRSRIEFAFDGWGYRFRVGGVTALATHGNEVDEYNFTRYDILCQIVREESLFGTSEAARGWKPNAGTVFVIDAINRIKKQYPFIDMLKPEVPVAFLALTVMAPEKLAVAEDVARLKAGAILNETKRPSSERRFLGEFERGSMGALAPDPKEVAAKTRLLEEKVNRYIHDPDRNIDDLIYGEEDELLGMTEWVGQAKSAIVGMIDGGAGLVRSASGWAADKASDIGKAAHAAALRKVLEPFVEEESFAVESLGASDRKLDDTIRDDYDVVFTGHTHVRRISRRGANRRGYFVNTGTWAGLMRLVEKDLLSAADFQPFYDLLASSDRQMLASSEHVRQERPVAVLAQVAGEVKLKLCRVADDGDLESDPDGKPEQTVKISES